MSFATHFLYTLSLVVACVVPGHGLDRPQGDAPTTAQFVLRVEDASGTGIARAHVEMTHLEKGHLAADLWADDDGMIWFGHRFDEAQYGFRITTAHGSASVDYGFTRDRPVRSVTFVVDGDRIVRVHDEEAEP